MAQEWKVTRAFQGKNKETNEPEIVPTKGGDMHKFLVQVEDQPVAGWMNILKKPGNEVKEGDVLYGDIVKSQWGKPQFNKSQRPDGSYGGQQQSAPAQSKPQQTQGGRIVLDERLEYAISLLQEMYPIVTGQELPTSKSKNDTASDDDDAPLNPDDLDY